MSSQAELPGAVEAKRAEREKPDCGGAAEPELGLGRAPSQKRSPAPQSRGLGEAVQARRPCAGWGPPGEGSRPALAPAVALGWSVGRPGQRGSGGRSLRPSQKRPTASGKAPVPECGLYS